MLLSTLATFALALQAAPAQPPPGRPVLRVGRVTSVISLDGRLDEPSWLAADSIDGLTEIEPTEGATPTGRTVVRVLADATTLFIGIRADDPEPERLTRFARARDADLSSEDHVKLVLDTYLDGRSGFVFAVNPNGARYDALVVSQGEAEDANWDAVWEAATSRTA